MSFQKARLGNICSCRLTRLISPRVDFITVGWMAQIIEIAWHYVFSPIVDCPMVKIPLSILDLQRDIHVPRPILILTSGNLLVNKIDLQVLWWDLSGTYCHKTGTSIPSCNTPEEPTIHALPLHPTFMLQKALQKFSLGRERST